MTPENAIYLQVAFAITVLSLAVYVGYALVRLRQAQDELRALRNQQQRGRASSPRTSRSQPLRSAEDPPRPH